jgi:hypothetical protein
MASTIGCYLMLGSRSAAMRRWFGILTLLAFCAGGFLHAQSAVAQAAIDETGATNGSHFINPKHRISLGLAELDAALLVR